jgi:hypothetical protein
MKDSGPRIVFHVDARKVMHRPAAWFAAMLELEARHRYLTEWCDQIEQEAEASRLMTVRPLPCERE